jgi:hypothetical protein
MGMLLGELFHDEERVAPHESRGTGFSAENPIAWVRMF